MGLPPRPRVTPSQGTDAKNPISCPPLPDLNLFLIRLVLIMLAIPGLSVKISVRTGDGIRMLRLQNDRVGMTYFEHCST
jgi:hypothetical protein